MNRLSRSVHDRKRIYLLRHAAVSYFDDQGKPLDPRGVPLNTEGREQADAAARVLATVDFDRAVCSGLPRTLQTARLVLADRPVGLETDDRLLEIRAGRLREVPALELEALVAYAYDGAERQGAAFIGGEIWQSFQLRVLAAWQDWIMREFNHLLIVAHDAVNRVLLTHVTGSGLAGLRAFEQDPACINIIDVDIKQDQVCRTLLRASGLTPYNLSKAGDRRTVMERIYDEYSWNRH